MPDSATPWGNIIHVEYLRTWLHARNALRKAVPNPAYKYLHDLDALGPVIRIASFHDRIRIEGIEQRYYARINRKRETR